jgi:phasin family protein
MARSADTPDSTVKQVAGPDLSKAPPTEKPMAAATETIKSAMEQFTTAGNQAFKDNMEKSLSALTQLNTYSKQNLEAAVASVTAAARGAEALGAQTLAYSKKSLEDNVAAARTLAGCKSLQEAVEYQTTFARTAMETYLAEMNRMSETFTNAMKDSLKPINERVTAVVERAQATR